jgi:hypothetical protein
VRIPLALAAATALLAACSGGEPQRDSAATDPPPTRAEPTRAELTRAEPTRVQTTHTATAPPTSLDPGPEPARFDAVAALADVRRLAGDIGPRLATGPGFRDAARVVERRLRRLGYDVRRQHFGVPAGSSWGVPVPAGRSFNVVATPRRYDASRPHVIVGAHLDTVAVAPGAEDNASGVAVLLELARLAAAEPTRLPTVLIAFGAEEPVGPADDQHHFGSQHYVREMPAQQQSALRAMVAIDRAGVGSLVPVCTGGLSPHGVRDRILQLARREDIPAQPCQLTTSDHWSFEKAGYAVARLGSNDYAEYHSDADLPNVVDRRQLARTGGLAWAWLSR